MSEQNLQQIADELKKFKGNVRGEAFRTRIEYIKKKEGEDGVNKLEEKLNELGIDIKLNKISPSEKINEGINTLSIVISKEIFSWADEDIVELGKFAFKTSFLTRAILRYLISPKIAINAIPKLWRSYYDFGEMEVVEFKPEENYGIVIKKGYKTHPVVCLQHKGYFLAGIALVLGNKKVSIEETKCMHKGDDYHEYTIKWQ